MYLGSALCCGHARLFGASSILSKHAVASLLTMMIRICMVLASLRDSFFVIVRSIAQHLQWPPLCESVSWW